MKQNKDLSMLSKNQECCYSYFKDMQDTFSQLDYSRMNVLCAIGSPYLPSCALFCADEVSCCAYKEGDQYAIAQDVALRKSRLGLITLYYRNKELGYFEDGSDLFKCKDPYRWVFERYLSRFNLKME